MSEKMTDESIDIVKIDDRVLSLLNQNDLTIPILIFFTVLIYQTTLGILRGINSNVYACMLKSFLILTSGTLQDILNMNARSNINWKMIQAAELQQVHYYFVDLKFIKIAI